MPKVSVIIPTYNRGGWLKETVRSVVNQTFTDFELIIVDDGSTDETEKIISEFEFPVRHIRQERKGVSAARNTGIAAARSNLIAFLDSDDLWQPEKLERQLAYLVQYPYYLIVHTDEIWIRNNRRVNPRKIHKKSGGWIFENSCVLCVISPSSALLRRELLQQVGQFDECLPACEDYDLWLRATNLFPVGYISEPLIVKRGGHPDQLSKKFWGMDRFRVSALVRILERGELGSANRRAALQTLRKKCDILAAGASKRGNQRDAERFRMIRDRFTT